MESVNHVFLGRQLAKDLFYRVDLWCEVDFSSLMSVTYLIPFLENFVLSSVKKQVIEVIIKGAWWCLRCFQNNMIFNTSKPRKDKIFDDVVEVFFPWCFSYES